MLYYKEFLYEKAEVEEEAEPGGGVASKSATRHELGYDG